MFKVCLENAAGPLDVRVVETEEEIDEAVKDLVCSTAYFLVGDRIVISRE